MDLNRIANMLLNMLMRKAMNKGINTAIDVASRKGKRAEDLTPAEREQANKARDLAKRTQQAARITRRIGR